MNRSFDNGEPVSARADCATATHAAWTTASSQKPRDKESRHGARAVLAPSSPHRRPRGLTRLRPPGGFCFHESRRRDPADDDTSPHELYLSVDAVEENTWRALSRSSTPHLASKREPRGSWSGVRRRFISEREL
jgi:hypothetical protein